MYSAIQNMDSCVENVTPSFLMQQVSNGVPFAEVHGIDKEHDEFYDALVRDSFVQRMAV